ncbi:MAG: hypothetical protein ACRD2Z_05295 [Thermoanaerobaculia bacterium]
MMQTLSGMAKACFAAALLTAGLAACIGHERHPRVGAPQEPSPTTEPSPGTGHAGHVVPKPRRFFPEGAGAPLFQDLGSYSWPIDAAGELAQRYFDQGLILTYGFNHAEAVRAYREAQRLDPECAMCFWGEAYALGPNINLPMADDAVPQAFAASRRAIELAATAKERALAEALVERYAAEPVEDRAPLDAAFAAAMREVAREYPEDLDIQTLFAESLMTTMPWDYYQDDGSAKPETDEAVAVLESVLARSPNHAGAIHFYIHAVEPSAAPERAEAPADRLLRLVPGAGHLVHMPAHIYLRVGRYHDASKSNEMAAAADETYITQCRAQGFYPAAYYPHNVHFLWAVAAFEGRSEVSIEAARKVVTLIPEEMVADVPILEELLPTHLFGLARFGDWDAILEQPAPAPNYRYLTGIWHYTRGLARLGRDEIEPAEEELARLREIAELGDLKELVLVSGSSAAALLGIAVDDLAGRLAAARGDYDAAIDRLRDAAEAQDALPYTEPPPWYFPQREALGEVLLRAGRPAEAAAVYREQLELTPRNGWSLFGLARSLEAQGRQNDAVAVERRLRDAWALADVELTASIF